MSIIKDTIAAAKWTRSRNIANKSALALIKHGIGFSLSEAKAAESATAGLVGVPKSLSKREKNKITAAAGVLYKTSASVYSKQTGKKRFDNKTPMMVGHFTPLKYSDPENVQLKSFQLSESSMHLRASQKFIQRVNFDPRIQAHPARRILNMSVEEIQEWSTKTESLWRSEKESKSWDEAERNDYSQLSDLALSEYLEKGEFFAVRRAYYDDEDRITNISIEIYSPFQICSPIFTNAVWINTGTRCNQIVQINAAQYLSELEEGHYIEAGIEYDKKGREIAIFIAPVGLIGQYTRVPVKNSAGFVQVLHGFIQQQPGQKRGIPESAHAWHEFANVKDLQLFELQSARLNASISGTVTADSNAQPNGKTPMNDLGHEKPVWTEDIPTGDSTLATYEPPDYDVRDVAGGGFIVQNFTPGYKYTEHETKRPNINIPEFTERMLEFIYTSMYGTSVSIVNQRLEGSYNASKGKLDLTWKLGVEYFLKQFSSDWHRPNYAAWLAGKIATGEIIAPGWENKRLRSAWSHMSVIIPPKPSLNPLQEAKAGAERIKYLASNMELEAQQQTGTSAEDNADKLGQQYGRLSEIMPEEETEVIE